MKFLFVSIHAKPVEPTPIQLSKIISFSFEYVNINHFKSGTGFYVGCFGRSILSNFKTVVGNLFPVLFITLFSLCFP